MSGLKQWSSKGEEKRDGGPWHCSKLGEYEYVGHLQEQKGRPVWVLLCLVLFLITFNGHTDMRDVRAPLPMVANLSGLLVAACTHQLGFPDAGDDDLWWYFKIVFVSPLHS